MENKLLEVILHSCEKRWYSSSGFITYLPCDVNVSPGGLMSVALVQARVSLQTTGVAAWLSPGISRVGSGAGSAHFHHCAHRVWLMKGLFEPMHVRSSFYLQSRHVTFTVACTESAERFKLWPLWSSNLHSMWLDEQELPTPSSMFVVKTPLTHLLQKKRAVAVVVAVKPEEPFFPRGVQPLWRNLYHLLECVPVSTSVITVGSTSLYAEPGWAAVMTWLNCHWPESKRNGMFPSATTVSNLQNKFNP